LADVQKKLGVSDTRRCSNAEGSPVELCYSLKSSPVRVVFLSVDAPDALSEKWLVGYKVFGDDESPGCYRQCPLATISPDDLQAGNIISIGMSRDEVLALLGKPKNISGDRYTFQWLETRKYTPKELSLLSSRGYEPEPHEYDFLDTIEVRFGQGRVSSFEVFFAVTY